MEERSERRGWPDLLGLWRRISKEARLAFLSAMGIGFVVHLYVFSNLLINHDSAVCLTSKNEHLTSGRWSLGFFSQFSWVYEMPVVIVLLSLCALACTAALTVKVLDISSPAGILLTSGFLVSFPSVCCVFPYLYTADAYFFALLLNALSVYLTKRFRFGWIAAPFCIALGLGIYQSFVCYAVALFLFDCAAALLSGGTIKKVLKQGGKYVLLIAAGLVMYRVLLAFFLWSAGTSLSNYKGMSEALNSGVLDYLRTLPGVYQTFFQFFLRPSFLTRPLQLFQRALFLFAGVCGIYYVLAKRMYREPVRLLLLFAGALLTPPAVNLIGIIAAGQTEVNLLMKYSFVLVFVFVIKILELTFRHLAERDFSNTRLGKFFKRSWKFPMAASLLVCFLLVWHYFCLTNAAYLRVELIYENSYALANRIMARVEEMDEYTSSTPVVFSGSTMGYFGNLQAFPELSEFSGMETTLVSDYCGTAFVRVFLGSPKCVATPEQRQEVLDSGVLDSMPIYPHKDSIRYYNGMVLVKLSQGTNISVFPG